MRWWWGLGLAFAVGLSGCLEFGGIASRNCEGAFGGIVGLPFDAAPDPARPDGRRTDPGQPWDALLFLDTSVPAVMTDVDAPDGWNAEADVWTTHGSNASLHWIRLNPASPEGAQGQVAVSWEAVWTGDGCRSILEGTSTVGLAAPQAGERPGPGKGTMVWTAGFWENGTLFYTNLAAVHNNPKWPRAGWYDYAGSDPLSVYVYDRARDERGPQWSACAPAPASACAWNYVTTIEGFNEALKGMSTTTARVVHIPPEKAYTRPGYESHPLYGDALVFYVLIRGVHDVPCTDLEAGPVAAGTPCQPPS